MALVYYVMTPQARLPRARRFSDREKLLLHLIQSAHYTSDELARLLALSPAETLMELRFLRVHGLVKPVLSVEETPTEKAPVVQAPQAAAPQSFWQRQRKFLRNFSHSVVKAWREARRSIATV